jgi:hypothetical protein
MYQSSALLFLLLMPGCSPSQERMVQEYAEANPDVSVREFLGSWNVRIHNNRQALTDLLPLLTKSDKLNYIDITNVSIPAAQFQQILDLPITYLWVAGGSVDVPRARILANKSRLQRLRITNSRLAGKFAPILVQLEALTELDLGNTAFVNSCFKDAILGEQVLSRLEKLLLSSCEIVDDDLKHIAKQVPNLKLLEVHATKVTGKGLLNLAPLHSLESVAAPDGTSIEDALNARKAHLDAKREARKAGIRVPADELSPFSQQVSYASEEQLAASGLLPDKRVQKARGMLRQQIINLVGSEKGMKIVWQVDEIIPEFAPKRNYIDDKRSLAEIMEQDFGIEFEEALRTRVGHPIKHPDDWGEIPEKPLRYYLSGRLEEAIKHLEKLK